MALGLRAGGEHRPFQRLDVMGSQSTPSRGRQEPGPCVGQRGEGSPPRAKRRKEGSACCPDHCSPRAACWGRQRTQARLWSQFQAMPGPPLLRSVTSAQSAPMLDLVRTRVGANRTTREGGTDEPRGRKKCTMTLRRHLSTEIPHQEAKGCWERWSTKLRARRRLFRRYKEKTTLKAQGVCKRRAGR